MWQEKPSVATSLSTSLALLLLILSTVYFVLFTSHHGSPKGVEVYTLTLQCPHGTETLVIPSSADKLSILDTISVAARLPIANFKLFQENGSEVAPEVLVRNADRDMTVLVQTQQCHANRLSELAPVSHERTDLPQTFLHDVYTFKSFSARLRRVAVCTIGIGADLKPALTALRSANKYFGGDSIPSFHILTDDVDAIPSLYNPIHVNPLERSMKDLKHFSLIEANLKKIISDIDYFIFIDPYVEISQPITLFDLAGDLFGVQHPAYPRDVLGYCQPRTKDGRVQSVSNQICEFPYVRNIESTAYVPDEVGKWLRKGNKKHNDGHNMVHHVSTFWYLHGGLWGGKSESVLKCIEQVSRDIEIDIQNGISGYQAEMYWNAYMWLQSNRSDMNLRIHDNSYLYPLSPGSWIENIQLPKIKFSGTLMCGESVCNTKM